MKRLIDWIGGALVGGLLVFSIEYAFAVADLALSVSHTHQNLVDYIDKRHDLTVRTILDHLKVIHD